MKNILTIGSSYMELYLTTKRLPNIGENLSDEGSLVYQPGGADVSLALAFSKLGMQSIFVSKLGADLHGQRLFEYYRSTGLDTSFLKVDRDFETGLELTICTGEGERKLHFPGANQNLTAENIEDAFAKVPSAVCLGFSLPYETLSAASKKAESSGVPVFFYSRGLTKDTVTDGLPVAEYFVVGEEDAFTLTGVHPVNHTEALRAALALYRKVHCRYLVIRLAGRGAFFYDGRHYRLLPPVLAMKQKSAQDKKAEEAFVAGLIFGILSGLPADDAVAFASAADAYVSTHAEENADFPTESDVKDVLSHNR